MKKSITILSLMAVLASCEERTEKAENSRGIPGPEKVEALKPESIEDREVELKEKGYQTFRYEEGDTTYLMQQYYVVFLKDGPNRNQDSTELAELQKQHLAHLSQMAEEGYLSLVGPTAAQNQDVRGLAIYNTATEREADSLARLDPMVQAGRLEVEVLPWWVAKGSQLQ